MSITDTTVRNQQATEPVHEQQQDRPRRIGVLVGVSVAALGAFAAITLALGADGADRRADTPAPVVPNPPAAYQPGGSVYDEQVPGIDAGRGSGSYLYDAQVPQPGPRVLFP